MPALDVTEPLPAEPLPAERKMAGVLLAAAAVDVADSKLIEALTLGVVGVAVEAVDWLGFRAALAGYEPILVAEYLSVVGLALDAAGLAETIIFDPTALARGWAYEHSAALIAEVTESSRDAVRQIIVAGVGRGASMDAVAGEVRAVVGLHPRWATAVANYRRRLIADGQAARAVETLTGRYRTKLLRARAMNIARWEVQSAVNTGKYRTWKEGQAEGLLPAGAMKRWDAETPTACPVCIALEQAPARLVDEPFPNGRLMPPDHVRCRCTAVLVGV